MDALLLAFGIAYVVAFCVAFLLAARRLVRRWRRLWRQPRRGIVRRETLATAFVLLLWYLGSRVVP